MADRPTEKKTASYRYEKTAYVGDENFGLITAIINGELEHKRPHMWPFELAADDSFNSIYDTAQTKLMTTIRTAKQNKFTESLSFKQGEQLIHWVSGHINLTEKQAENLKGLYKLAECLRKLQYLLTNKDGELEHLTTMLDVLKQPQTTSASSTSSTSSKDTIDTEELDTLSMTYKKKIKQLLQEWQEELTSLQTWITELAAFDTTADKSKYEAISEIILNKSNEVFAKQQSINETYELNGIAEPTTENTLDADYQDQATLNYCVEIVFYRVKKYVLQNPKNCQQNEPESSHEADSEMHQLSDFRNLVHVTPTDSIARSDLTTFVANITKHAILQHFGLPIQKKDIPEISLEEQYAAFFAHIEIGTNASSSASTANVVVGNSTNTTRMDSAKQSLQRTALKKKLQELVEIENNYSDKAKFDYCVEVIFYRVKAHLSSGQNQLETNEAFIALVSQKTKEVITTALKLPEEPGDLSAIANINEELPNILEDIDIDTTCSTFKTAADKQEWQLTTLTRKLAALEKFEQTEAQRQSNLSQIVTTKAIALAASVVDSVNKNLSEASSQFATKFDALFVQEQTKPDYGDPQKSINSFAMSTASPDDNKKRQLMLPSSSSMQSSTFGGGVVGIFQNLLQEQVKKEKDDKLKEIDKLFDKLEDRNSISPGSYAPQDDVESDDRDSGEDLTLG